MKQFNKLKKTANTFKMYWLFIITLTFGMAGAQVNIQVNSHQNERKNISPYIYGINAYVYTPEGLTGIGMHDADINSTSFRFGGDAVSTYNWEINRNTSSDNSCHNPIPDIVYDTNSNPGYYSNHNNGWVTFVAGNPGSNTPAGAILKLADDAEEFNAYPLVQITAMNYVAADDDGCLAAEYCGNPGPSGRFKNLVIEKPGALSTNPDLNDDYVYADEEINYLISELGNSTTPTGIKGYGLENEPGIWGNTHVCLHPQKTSCGEVLSTNINLAKRIKQLDPNAETFGPAAWGFVEYMQLNVDTNFAWGTPGYFPVDWDTYDMSDVAGFNPANYNYMTWLASYLRQMKQASEDVGVRLLDALDIHYYGAGNNVRQDSRSFWDPTYVENSWIANDVLGGQGLNLAYNFHKLIDDFYPGTKLSVSEWGYFDNNISSSINIADMLGAFGSKDVYMANYFGRVHGFIAGAFRIYTNYDGNNGRFGSIGVSTNSSDNSLVTVYASLKNDSEGEMDLVLINRSNSQQNISISIDTDVANYQAAKVYALLSNNNGAVTEQEPLGNIANNSINYTLQPGSVYHIVLKDNTIMNVNDMEQNISLYPNPVKNVLHIQHNQMIEKVEVLDLNGRMILSKDFNSPAGNINLEKLSPGTYVVKVSSGNQTKSSKIIKK